MANIYKSYIFYFPLLKLNYTYRKTAMLLCFLPLLLFSVFVKGQAVDLPNPPANLQTVTTDALIIPMHNAVQNLGTNGAPFNLKAYGLINALLQNDIPIKWVILSGKVKDAVDFSATAERVYPSFLAAALIDFRASAFIIDSFYVNNPFRPNGQTATQVITSFANNVAVYKLTQNVTVDVRYNLNQRPKIAVFNNGGNQVLHTKILDAAGISNYVAISAGVFTGLEECYTFCSEPHWASTSLGDTVITNPVRNFVLSGGNFFAQCRGVETYEFHQLFHTTNNISVLNTTVTNAYYNNDLAYMQFEGLITSNQGGSERNWVRAPGSQWDIGFYYSVSNGVNDDTIVAAGAHLIHPDSTGGNVFYLGGHDYFANGASWTNINQLNAARLYLNAALVPAGKPTAFLIDPGPNQTICAGQSVTLGGSPTAPSGSTYQWSPSTGLDNSTLANPVASPSVTTTYTVEAWNGGCAGIPATVTVTVNPIPTAPTAGSNSPVCEGAILNLTADTISGATYNWTGPNSFTSSLQNPSVNNVTSVNAGTYAVTVTIGGCTGPAGTTSVTVNPIPATPTAGSNSPVCEGATLSLTASTISGATYNWTGPNSFTSTSQNPSITNATTAMAGTYSVTATVNGCTSLAGTISVTINPIPPAPTAGSNSPLCEGTTLNLTASTVAGAIYNWTGPNSFTSTSQNPSITNVIIAMAGTYSVTATVNGCTSPAGTTAVTISPVPAIPTATNNGPICEGATLNLTASTISGATYNWTGPNSFTSTSQNPSITNVTLAMAGTYSVTATVNGCASSAGTTIVTIDPTPSAPTAGNDGPLCEGATLNLTASTISGATYNWTGPNSFTSTSQNPSITNVTPAMAGTYSVMATVNGCTGPAGTTSVTINPIPAAPTAGSDSPICEGGTLNLTASTIVGATYNWTGPNSFTSTSQNPSITNVTTAMAGTYSVTATANGCTSPAGTTAVIINPPPSTPTVGNNGPLCEGATLNLTAGSVTAATYSWTGPNSFTSTSQNPTITNVTTSMAGTYSVTVTVPGCTSPPAGTTSVTINPIPATPTAGTNSPLCEGATLNLTASTIFGATYNWTGPNSFTSTDQNPSITNATTVISGTYSVTATANGCTSPAGTISVTVNPIPAAPTAGNNGPLCEANTLNLTATTITGATYNWTGPNSFTSTSQNPSITNVTTAMAGTYSVTATVNGCTSPAGTTAVTISPVPATPTAANNGPICEGATLNLTASTITAATYNWTGPNSFTSTSQNPSITNVTLAMAGTYSVTATVNGCASSSGTTTVTIDPTPSAPTAGNDGPLCEGATLNLTASTISGATYNWTGPNSFTSTSQNPSITNVTLAMTGTYSVTATVNGCTSTASTTSVTINPIPAAPSAGSDSPVCEGGTLNLTASTISGATYNWTGPNSFTSTSQNPSITNVTLAMTGTYSVTATVNGCTSTASTTSVTINPIPAAPIAGSNTPVCEGNTLNLTASTIAGATYNWTGPNSFTSTSQNPSITNVTTAMAGTYSVTATVNGCTSPAGTTAVIINPPPSTPTVGNNGPLCEGATLNLTSSSVTAATYSWTGPNSFTSTSQNPSITNVTIAMAGTYSVTVTVPGCTSPPAGTISVTINPIPATPTAGSNSPVCEGATLNLTASTISGATYNWTGPNSFTSTNQNPSITNVTIAMSGTYSVTATVNGCTSPAGTISVTINPTDNPSFLYSSGTYCSTGTNPTPTITGGFPGSFSATPVGLVLNATTGEINLSASTLGTYAITYTTSGPCPDSSSANVTITNLPDATFSYATPFCQYEPNPLPIFPPGASAGVFSATPAGLVFVSTSTGEIDLNSSAPGSYTVTNTIAAGGGCPSATATNTVTIEQGATVNAGPNQTICTGTAATLAGIVGGSATGGTWSGGAGTFSPDNTTLNAAYTPTLAETTAGSVTLTLTTDDPAGVCNAVADSMVITISPLPPSPTALNDTICEGTSTTLTATAPGGTYQWYNAPTGGTLLATNASYTTPVLTATTSYYVQTTLSGCTSLRTQVTVTVTPLDDASFSYSSGTFCITGTNPTPAITGGFTGTFSSSPAGLAFVNSATGEINLSGSSLGTYSVTFTTNSGPCPNSSSVTVIITNAPDATFSYNSPFCEGGTNPLPSFPPGSSAGTFSATPAGLVFVNTGTGEIDLSSSAVGTYTITNTIVASGGCAGTSYSDNLTIDLAATANAGPNQTICAGQTVTLAGSIGGSAISATWSGGTGTYAPNNTDLNAVYTPSAGEITAGTVTLTLTTDNPTGPCGSATSQVTVTINLDNASFNYSSGTYCITGSNPTPAITGGFTGTFSSSPAGLVFINTSTGEIDVSTSTLGTYSVTFTTNGSCPNSSSVNITITNAPDATFSYNTPFCQGGTNPLPVFLPGASAGVFSATPAGLVFVSSSTGEIDLSSSAVGTYTVTNTIAASGGCAAATASNTVTIEQAAIANAGPNQTICSGSTVTLAGTLGGSATTGTWSGGNGTFSPNNTTLNAVYTPDSLEISNGSVTLTLTTDDPAGPCSAATDQVTITITVDDASFSYSSGTYCVTGTNPTPTINGGVTGTFSASPAGLTFSNTSTGTINLSASSLGTYTVTFTTNGPCPDSSSVSVTITNSPDATFSYNDPFCEGGANEFPFYFPGASAGVFSATPAGIVFVNTATGEIDMASSAPGTYSVTNTIAASGGCAAATFTYTTIINALPMVNAGPDQFICTGTNSASLNGSVTGITTTGEWTTLGDGTFTPNSTTLNGTYTLGAGDISTGSITLVLESSNNGNCSVVYDTLVINITTVPTVDAGLDQVVCANNADVVLNGTITGGSGSGIWTSNGTGVFSPNDTTLNATYQPSNADTAMGVVTLILSATNSCLPVQDTVQITITPAPVVDAGPDQNVCNNETVTLNGSVTIATGAIWTTNGTGGFMPNDSTLNATYLPSPADITAGTVTLVLTSYGNGDCNPVSDSLVITIGTTPVADFTSPTACLNQSVTFTDASTVSVGTINAWEWNIDNNIFTTDNASFAFTTAGTFNVQLVATSNIGCSDTVMQTITVNPLPVAAYSSSFDCASGVVIFTDNSTMTGGTIDSWSWNFGDSTSSALQNPSHNYVTAGTYSVTLTVTSLAGCSESFTSSVTIDTSPDAEFTVSSAPYTTNQSISFTDNSTGGISWSWDFGNSSGTSTEQNPSYNYTASGTYVIVLTVNGANGCSDTAIFEIIITGGTSENGPVAVPSGFSPNGDSKNDILYVKGGPFIEMEFRIFNEWGSQLFRSDRQQDGWDGKFKGANQPGGIYVYTLTGITVDKEEIKMAGNVTLLR